MKEINLLEQAKDQSKVLIGVSVIAKKIALVFIISAVILSIVMIGGLFYTSNRLKISKASETKVKSQIASLQATEQRLFLLKDRITKTGEILKTPDSSEGIEILEDIVNIIETPTEIKGIELDKDNTKITFLTTSSFNIAKLLSMIVGSQNYTNLKMLSFKFLQSNGYEIELELAK